VQRGRIFPAVRERCPSLWAAAGVRALAFSLWLALFLLVPSPHSFLPGSYGILSAGNQVVLAQGEGAGPGGADAPDAPSFPVAGFRFTGNTAFSQEELAGLLIGYTGRELTLPELEQAAARIARFYHEHGYFLASTHVPPQEITDGVVEIAVVEGRYGQVVLDNASGVREGVARALLGDVRPGVLIREQPLDRGLRLLNEIPGVDARSSLRAGTAPGTSDLTVALSRTKPVTIQLTADNFGSAATERMRTAVALEWVNPLGIGDRFHLRWLGAGSAMRSWHAAYEGYVAPPWRLGVSYTDSWYELGGVFAGLESLGTGSVWQVWARYPLVRSGGSTRDVTVAYQSKMLRDSMLGEETPARVQALMGTVRWSGRGLGREGVWASSSGEAWVSVVPGTLAFLDDAAAKDDEDTAQAAGGFVRLEAGGTIRVPVGRTVILLVSASGQWASKNLYRSEKFSLGGPDGVRAFPVGEASGDMGVLFRAEVRYAPPVRGAWVHGLELGAFVDYGSVTINQKPWSGAGGSNHRSLLGAGIGVSYSPAEALAVRADYAVPLGQDTSGAKEPQLWLRAELRW